MCGANTASINHYLQLASDDIGRLLDQQLVAKLTADTEQAREVKNQGHWETAEDLAYDTWQAAEHALLAQEKAERRAAAKATAHAEVEVEDDRPRTKTRQFA